MSEEDENNNYLIDPDTIDLTKEDINPEAMDIIKINGTTCWNDLVEESSQRYVTTMRQEPPKIKIVSVKGGNGEEHAGETCSPDDEMSAAMPGGKNHVTTDAAGQSGILRALLKRASRDDIHLRRKHEEEFNLEKKNTLERKNRNTNQKEERNKNEKTDQIKWKNIMTLIHHSALQNINLTCGGNCILRREMSGSEISSGNTVSMHSGTDDQSERTAVGGETTRDRRQRMSRDRMTTSPVNKETCYARRKVTSEGRNEAKTKMEREESRLLRIYRKKLRRREEEEVRRASRIEHLRNLISQIPDVEKIPEDEDHRIEEEIDEAERSYNALDESKTIFRIMKEVCDRDDNEVAQFNATINLKTDPTRMRADKQGIMAIVIIKKRVETKLLGDIDMNAIGHLQIKMSGVGPIELKKQERQRRDMEIAVPEAVMRDEINNAPTERGESPVNTQPEVTSVPCPDTIEREITIQEMGEQENITPRTTTPKTPTPQGDREHEMIHSSKQRHCKRKRYVTSESSDESTSEEEVIRKKTRTHSRKKKPQTRKKGKKTVAKDGRKLADLTNRERDERGRLLGYKPGTEPAKIQRKKKQSPEDTQRVSKRTPETQTNKPRIKIPTILPKPTTPSLKV